MEEVVCLGFQVWGRRRRKEKEGVYDMGQREEIELKFRIYDGTDIGHHSYAPSMTVANLKKRLLAEWPQGNIATPKLDFDEHELLKIEFHELIYHVAYTYR